MITIQINDNGTLHNYTKADGKGSGPGDLGVTGKTIAIAANTISLKGAISILSVGNASVPITITSDQEVHITAPVIRLTGLTVIEGDIDI